MSEITNKMRCDQMKMIDIYLEAAKEDDKMHEFLVNLATKLDDGLLALGDSECPLITPEDDK